MFSTCTRSSGAEALALHCRSFCCKHQRERSFQPHVGGNRDGRNYSWRPKILAAERDAGAARISRGRPQERSGSIAAPQHRTTSRRTTGHGHSFQPHSPRTRDPCKDERCTPWPALAALEPLPRPCNPTRCQSSTTLRATTVRVYNIVDR